MAFCPSCGAEIAQDAVRCPNCNAIFEGDATWKPLSEKPPAPAPSRAARVCVAATKLVLVLASLAMLLLGGLLAWSRKGHGDWVMACLLTAVAVVVVAVKAKLRWSILLLFIAIAVGFTSCAANFELNLR